VRSHCSALPEVETLAKLASLSGQAQQDRRILDAFRHGGQIKVLREAQDGIHDRFALRIVAHRLNASVPCHSRMLNAASRDQGARHFPGDRT
jgi:hypothetical protein